MYYKRYRPKQETPSSVYQAVQSQGQAESQSDFPVDRTLQVLSFDSDLEFSKVLWKKIGKIRKFFTGESRYQGKEVHYAIVVFKFQYDLVKCFAEEFLQNKIAQIVEGTRPNQEEVQEQRREIIVEHLGNELDEAGKLAQLYEEGFNPVTNKFGEFKVNRQANEKGKYVFMQLLKIYLR